MPGLSDPETRVSLTLTLAQAPLSSGSDPDSGSSWVSIIWPPRPATSRPHSWLLSSQPAVHPGSIRLRSGPRTLGKVCGQHNSSLDLLATCSSLSENQFSTSWGICWLIFLTSKYLFRFAAQGGYDRVAIVVLALRHT